MDRYQTKGDQAVDIATKNLSLFDRRQADLFESRLALIRELSGVLMANSSGELSHFERLREAYMAAFQGERDTKLYAGSNEFGEAKGFFDAVSIIEKLEICRALTRSSASSDIFRLLMYTWSSSQSEYSDPASRGRIAYMKNSFTESAFLKFSKIVPRPRSAYFQSFDAVCEEVYSGSCEYCILPIESSLEGRLNSFYSMIDRYELKISAVCIVEQHDSQRFTKFALLKKSLSESATPIQGDSEQILEFKISSAIGESDSPPFSEGTPVCDILLAAKASGMKLLRIDSMPLPYNDEMMAFYISFLVDRSQLMPFLLYLTLEFPQFDPLGLYFVTN